MTGTYKREFKKTLILLYYDTYTVTVCLLGWGGVGPVPGEEPAGRDQEPRPAAATALSHRTPSINLTTNQQI